MTQPDMAPSDRPQPAHQPLKHQPLGQLGHLISPAQYQQLVKDILATYLPARVVQTPLADSQGLYTATDLLAPSNLPAFANSQMDGYALTATAADRPNRVFTVGQDIPAGWDYEQLEISDDLVYPIMTGAPLPAGYDCVIPEEKAQPLGKMTASFAAYGSQVQLPLARPGQFVRYPGEDIKASELVAPVGTYLTPAYLGTLAAQGIGSVPTKTPLRVLLLTGGDEVLSQNQVLTPGKIFDANGPLLTAQLDEFSAQVRRHHLTDKAQDLVDFLKDYLVEEPLDLIISSGGISHGKYEVVKNAVSLLQENTYPLLEVSQSWFGHVSQQPGGPQGLTLLKDRESAGVIPLISLPGNPVSSLISFALAIRPALSAFYSGQEPQPQTAIYEGEPMSAPAGKTQFRRANFYQQPNDPNLYVRVDPATGSHLLHRAATANALAQLEPGKTYQRGDTINFYPLYQA